MSSGYPCDPSIIGDLTTIGHDQPSFQLSPLWNILIGKAEPDQIGTGHRVKMGPVGIKIVELKNPGLN